MGVCAAALTLGAVQLAAGGDLYSRVNGGIAGMPEAAVNRAAKADRLAGPARSAGPTQTISLRPMGLTDTSILVRVPLPTKTSDSFFGPVGTKKPGATVACEPMVSVLTEVAKQLQPGRCVT